MGQHRATWPHLHMGTGGGWATAFRSCFRQQPFPGLHQVRSLRIPVFDDPVEDLYKYFEQCSNAIEDTARSGGKCLVYCKNGRSRSAAICMAYLMRHQNLTLQDAFETVKTARPGVEPNAGFWSQLQRYEEHLQMQHPLGYSSKKKISSK
nr:dual specificity phosphatase 28 isoform X2 [Pelodiscus sinensis]|eukprot:XP_025041495.1 dual specificity phosphatase 28 isoform X2 [Pelodiscus sinensis]